MQYWNPKSKLNIEHNIETNFGSKIFLNQNFSDLDSFVQQQLFWTTTTTTTTTIEMGFDIIEINLVSITSSSKSTQPSQSQFAVQIKF